jgi:Ras GTPase-activating-like protein IQGAP2/3
MFLSKQYRHQRALAKEGKGAKFGSYTYTATDLNEKGMSSLQVWVLSKWFDWLPGILLKINQFSPRQYDKVQISISSNEVGIFSIEMATPSLSTEAIMGYEQIRMEDLLQAQFDNEQNLLLFDGVASFSINMLIHQINKSKLCRPCRHDLRADLQNSTLNPVGGVLGDEPCFWDWKGQLCYI